MNLLADENINRQIVDLMRQNNYSVYYVAEMGPGIFDDIVLNFANKKKLLLLTTAKDFGELVFLTA